MKLIPGKSVFFVVMPLAAAALIAVGGARATAASPTTGAAPVLAFQDDPGEGVMNRSCTACHDLRPIQTSAKTPEQWTVTIEAMVAQGAEVEETDIPTLVGFLSEHFGPIPEGTGKQVILTVCTQCHDLKRIKLGHRSAEEWMETLNSMLNEGAPLSDADYPLALGYLARNFGAE